MPNGFHNDPAIDLIFHRHTEHGHYQFHTHRSAAGLVSVHLEHDRGYAYEPRWDSLDLGPWVRGRRPRPTRAQMEELTADLVHRLVALQASNPRSRVRADRASALLLLDGWCILLGGYHTYLRRPGQPLTRVVPPVGSRCDDTMRQTIAAAPQFEDIARDTHVMADQGLMFHGPGECVYDLAGFDELLATTVPLHDRPEWPDIAGAPLDSLDSTGRLVLAMRAEAIAHGSDHLAVRWRAPALPTAP